MFIHAISDTHLEHGPMPDTYKVPNCDVVILAGDISNGSGGVAWAMKTFTQPVIYVPGNHETWGRRQIRTNTAQMKEVAEGSNVHVLNNDTVIVEGVRFIGATMWTDFNLYGNAPLIMISACTADSEQISSDDRPGDSLTAEDMIREHMYSRFFINEELAKPFDGKTVVVTHHAPSSLSIHPMYEREEKLNPAYASRLEDLMLDHNPELWIHGHTHNNFDYEIGNTRVVCNPRGYVGHHLNPNFDPELLIEI